MAERESRRPRSNNKKKEKERRNHHHVKLSSHVDELSICGEAYPSDKDSIVTLTPSEQCYQKYMNESDDARYEAMSKKNGWCSKDGTPWSKNRMPKDEAALLKKGVVDRTCARMTYCNLESSFSGMGQPRFYDEVELLKKGYLNKKGHHQNIAAVCSSPKNLRNGVLRLSHEPINIAELNSRGFVDENGKLHYGIPSLTSASMKEKKRSKKSKKKKAMKEAADGPRVVIKESHESFSITKTPVVSDLSATHDSETRVSFSPSREYNFSECSKNKKKSKKPSKSRSATKLLSAAISPSQPSSTSDQDFTTGTIRCQAGYGKDCGVVTYTVTKDGRNYEVKQNDHFIHLEFNKKHAYLIVN